MLIDSHCHLDYLSLDAYEGSLQTLLDVGRRDGVTGVLTVSVQRDNVATVLDIAARHDQVWASVGVHPLHADDLPSEAELLAWAAADEVVAIGETGLDYHYDRVPGEVQRESFRTQLRAAARLGLPVIVHTREARADTLEMLQRHCSTDSAGVLHCFTENWEMARAALDLNFYISFSGIVTFRNADALREVARKVPLERLLLETDAPYLAPVPHRGKANEPRFLPAVADCVATLRGLHPAELAEHCNANFFRLFRRARTDA